MVVNVQSGAKPCKGLKGSATHAATRYTSTAANILKNAGLLESINVFLLCGLSN